MQILNCIRSGNRTADLQFKGKVAFFFKFANAVSFDLVSHISETAPLFDFDLPFFVRLLDILLLHPDDVRN